MFWFSNKKNCSEGDLSAIQERVKIVEHDLKLIRVEWEEIYDKIVHQFDRERKRRKESIDAPVVDSASRDPSGSGSLSGEAWQDPIFIMNEARKRGI